MDVLTEVQLSGYPIGTETSLLQDLRSWLSEERGLSTALFPPIASQDPAAVSLVVISPAGLGPVVLARSLVAWLHDRHPTSNITAKFSASGRTAVLRSATSDAEIERTFAGANPEIFEQWWLARSNRFSSPPQATGFIAAVEENNASEMPVTIYLSDEGIHEEVEAAVEALLATAGLRIGSRDDPIAGSWFRRMKAFIKEATHSPAAREAALVAAHVADTRFVLAQDAAVTATLLQNLGPVLGALQPTKDAVIRAGALLIVKVDWSVHVFQLTAAQQAMLDHQPQLARSPHEIITALDLADGDHRGDGRPELT